MDATHLAKLALARLPRPYTDQVILHVFCEIERTPHLRATYDNLTVIGDPPYDKGGLNIQIARAVNATLNATSSGSIPVSGICEIVGSVSLLQDIKDHDWVWD